MEAQVNLDFVHKILNEINKKCVLVFGDCFLDIYQEGHQSRNAFEDPTKKVFDVTAESIMVGGAANVAANCAALGTKTILVSLIGHDHEGEVLRKRCFKARVISCWLAKSTEWITITKTRAIDAETQKLIFRTDRELNPEIANDFRDDLWDCVKNAFRWPANKPNIDAIAISDYAKGTFSEFLYRKLLKKKKQYSVPIIIDPKGDDFAKYQNCTIIKPNAFEATTATGKKDVFHAVKEVRRQTGAEVVVTEGESGAICLGHDPAPFRVNSLPTDNPFVIGAGDSTLAGLACATAAGFDLKESATFAMLCGAASVRKRRTAIVSKEDIEKLFS